MATQKFEELTEAMRPQDPHGDGTGLRFTVTDAEGRWCVYVPLRMDGKIVVPAH